MKVLVDKDFLEDGLELICDKIRLKTGGTGVLAFPVEIAQAVETIETGSGGIVPEGTKTITENGEGINVAPYEFVDVAVPIPTPPSGTKQITANGNGIDVAAYAAVDVAVPTGITPSGKKTITANGTGIDVAQYAEVDVAVPSTGYDEVVWTSSSMIATASTNRKLTATFYLDQDEKLGGIQIKGGNRTTQWVIYDLLLIKEKNTDGGWLGEGWKGSSEGTASGLMIRPQVTVTHEPSGTVERYTVEIDLSNEQYSYFTTEANNYYVRPLRMR